MSRTVPPDPAAARTEPEPPPQQHRHQHKHQYRIGYLAAGATAFFGSLALVWTVTGRGYPFGTADSDGSGSLLWRVPAEVGAPVFAVLLLGAAVTALAMAGPHAVRLRGAPRVALLGYGWLVVAGLLLVVPDVQVLTYLGYAPMLIGGLPFGWPPVDYSELFTLALGWKVFSVVTGLLLARAVVTWQFRTARACPSCGRRPGEAGWTSAESAARWGRWAVRVAAVIPVLYAIVRLAWAAGIPLGITDEFLREMQRTGLVWAGAGLAAFGLVGAVLTLGLAQRWGERFPRWMIGLAGRRVPIKLAVVPATGVAVAITAAGLSLYGQPELLAELGGGTLTVLPMLLWPVWGTALGAATLAYHLRRRGACDRC
ncbi:hypothetical protein GCM10022225_44250 [Plantactinospora mayteni]|uniref:Uncharacterized protein n=1 Tax=Plantactinospora mayteni TaxID=566021 RepID=A0ABQ4ERY7_9ACTN|nr:hypothetical protein [Plantactinospora mayteni]GIG97365.1 hypothetical protein Pma05_39380 [Plantactinospora mayteni]